MAALILALIASACLARSIQSAQGKTLQWMYNHRHSMVANAIATRRSLVVAVLICSFAYLYVSPYYPRINNPNENVRFYMTVAMVEQRTYAIDAIRQRWGWVNDAARYDGRLYSVKAPGTSLLGVPAYAAYRKATELLGIKYDRHAALYLCRLTASILPTLLFMFFLFRWFSRCTDHPLLRDCVFFSVALGSLLYGYALLFVSHTLSAAAGFGAFMILYDARHRGRRGVSAGRAFGAGVLTASVTLLEYPGLVASVVLAVYALKAVRPAKRLFGFAAGGLIPTLAVMHFQWRAFGSPLTPGHLYVENQFLRQRHHEGLYGAVGPSWEAFYGLVIDPAAGLLPLTPILFFAVVGFASLLARRQRRADALVAVCITLLTLLVICSMNNWRGGWTIGPRYLAIVVPFLAWGALEGLGLAASRFPRLAFSSALGCTVVSMLASGAPSAYYPHLPPELSRPLPQLIRVLIAHDYAPSNAGSLLDIYGTASMGPLFAVAAFSLVWICRSISGAANRVKTVTSAALLAALLLWPLCSRPAAEPGVTGAVAFITRNWSPAGHDRTARLARKLQRSGSAKPELYRQLADAYRDEGRFREAETVSVPRR